MRLRVDAIWTLATLAGGDVVAYIFKEFVQRATGGTSNPESGFVFLVVTRLPY